MSHPFLPEFLREKRHQEKSVGGVEVRGGIYSPVHLLPGTYIHLMVGNRLQAELLGENDQLWQQWPTN